MNDDNVVVSFTERLEAKKNQDKEVAKSVQDDEDTLSHEEIATKIFNELENEIERQKENVEIWSDVLTDLFEDCESINDLISYAQALSFYSTGILNNIVDSEYSDDYINNIVTISFQENNKPILDLGYKLDKLINKDKK